MPFCRRFYPMRLTVMNAYIFYVRLASAGNEPPWHYKSLALPTDPRLSSSCLCSRSASPTWPRTQWRTCFSPTWGWTSLSSNSPQLLWKVTFSLCTPINVLCIWCFVSNWFEVCVCTCVRALVCARAYVTCPVWSRLASHSQPQPSSRRRTQETYVVPSSLSTTKRSAKDQPCF